MIISSVVSAACRFIRSLAILFLLAPQTVFADFCSVDNFGNVTSCFPSADMCQQWARTSQGHCVFRQSGGTPAGGGAPQGGDWLGNLNQTLGGIAERQRAAIKDAKANTPDYLLPLSTPSQPTSRETIAIIESTLKTALEMEPGQALKEWANPAKGSKGIVGVEVVKQNQFGDACREFIISLDYSSERRGLKGNACRNGGAWRILGSVPLEFRDGKIVQDEPAPSASRNKTPIPTRLPRSAECLNNINCQSHNCYSGRCAAGAGSIVTGEQCVLDIECAGSSNYCHEGRCRESTQSQQKTAATKPRGAGCSENSECESTNCIKQRCAAYVSLGAGEQCVGNIECSGTLVCREGRCGEGTPQQATAPKPRGGGCSNNSDCVNKNCYSGRCVAASASLLDGQECKFDLECSGTLLCLKGHCGERTPTVVEPK